MTLRELSQLYYLNREIEMDRRRLSELEAHAFPGGQSFTGTPHGDGTGRSVENLALEIESIRSVIEAKQRRCLRERNRLERYIFSIEDSLLRQIFSCRFVDGLSWQQVAARVGGGNTAPGVKMLCYRFLRKN